MHHPPKAMGQAPLNAYYYNALILASKLAGYIKADEKKYLSEATEVKKSFNKYFFDSEKGLYFDGLDDKTENVSAFMPENVQGRFYSKYTNVLASLYGLCNDCEVLLEKTLYKSEFSDVQPYFMHYILDAIYKCGLFDKYGIREIKRWTSVIEECPKGMKEAWIIYKGYGFDYSHVWGASPAYHLPARMSGLEILGPGMKKVRLKPNLFGLKSAEINIPTMYGKINIKLKENTKAEVSAPKEVEIIL